MDGIKGKIAVVVGIIVFILFLYGIYYLLFIQRSTYYTQIDNSKMEGLSATDSMKYEYTLTAYDEKGKEKEVTFKTNRELREDAYLKLEVMLTRGVLNWEEVQFEEMPKEVREKYS
jgi:uncharacterized protein (TIGR01655 family)